MQAYRTNATVQNGYVTVELPEGFENADVEIIVLRTSPIKPAFPRKKGKFDRYYGILKTDLTIEEIDVQLKLLRDEWEQPIS